MNITKLLEDYRIPYATDHKNVRDGWIGIHCPFCAGEDNYHLGYSLDENYFSCWRCGGHPTEKVVMRLLKVGYNQAEEIVEQYGGNSRKKEEPRVKAGTSKFKFPSGPLELERPHKLYLERRGFDWEYLQQMWGIKGTGPISKLDGINYSNRILAPIIWKSRFVSFQARDITNRHMAKYMACPPEREMISHKHILYGNPHGWGDVGLCVEGITDVWRLGPEAFAVFGIKYTIQQVLAMKRLFKEVAILFDPEPFARKRARTLLYDLQAYGVKARVHYLDSDPGDLPPDDAGHLVRNILRRLDFLISKAYICCLVSKIIQSEGAGFGEHGFN